MQCRRQGAGRLDLNPGCVPAKTDVDHFAEFEKKVAQQEEPASFQNIQDMASAYKNATRESDDSDSDVGVFFSGEDSSHTIEADTLSDNTSDEEVSPPKGTSKLGDLPVELRNRVLMLTSRGVSYR